MPPQDSQNGSDEKGETFWQFVKRMFHEEMTAGDRSSNFNPNTLLKHESQKVMHKGHDDTQHPSK